MRSRWMRALTVMIVTAMAVMCGSDARHVDACSGSYDVVAESAFHPDLPLDGYLAGDLGLLRPTFARAYLAVAYVVLSGRTLDAATRDAMVRMFQQRLFLVDASKVGKTNGNTPYPIEVWKHERNRVLGVDVNLNVPIASSYYASYASIENCPQAAFETAAATLRERESRKVAPSALRGWVEAQDKVFSACERPKSPTLPAPPTASMSRIARDDREYQIASAYFYLGDFDEAEKRFAALGRRRSSAWSMLARYLVMRTKMRRATLAQDKLDVAEVKRAIGEADAIITERSLAVIHPMTERYREHLVARIDPAGVRDIVARRIERDRTSPQLAEDVASLTFLLDKDETVLARADAKIAPLVAWLGIMQGKRKDAFQVALERFRATHSTPWLVAALLNAKQGSDPGMAELRAAGLSLPPRDAAFATARYHLRRLELGGARGSKKVYEEIAADRAALKGRGGRSTQNAFAALMRRAAPSFDAYLKQAVVRPAGASSDFAPVEPAAQATPGLPEEVVALLAAKAPLSLWREASHSQALPLRIRREVAWATYVRALLLGDRTVASAVASQARRRANAVAAAVDAVEHAKSPDARALEVLALLLKVASRESAPSGGALSFTIRLEDDYAHAFGVDRPHESAPWADKATEAQAAREQKKLEALGPAQAYLASEAARVAMRMPSDPRVPELLHLAVKQTKNWGDQGPISAASRKAYEVLHKRYPNSVWAKKTKYYY